MRAIVRIRERLLVDHGVDLPADTELRRTYAGPWQRAAGQWSWMLWSPSNPASAPYGSQYSATDLLKCTDWSIDEPNRVSPDLAIEPCNRCQKQKPGTCKTPAKETP